MGTWGAGSFENDTAMDWTYDIKTILDVRKPFETLKEQTDSYKGEGDMHVDADLASELVAAAETVAMLMGRKIPEFPEDLSEQLENAGQVDDLLFHQARNAVLHVFRHSELTELWAEDVEEGDVNEWTVEILRLIDRLDPELEFLAFEQDEIEDALGGIVGNCAFCDKPIDAKKIYGAQVTDYSDVFQFEKGFAFHLECLSGRMHPKHAIHFMKTDPDNMPDLDKL